MTVTAAPVSTAQAARRSRDDAPAQVLGGEAWIVPFERGGHPWLSASAPQISVTDRRPASAPQISVTDRRPAGRQAT